MVDKTTKELRKAVENRAVWFALLYKKLEKTAGKKKAEALAREAIKEFGVMKAKKDFPATPKKWVKTHKKNSGKIFNSKIKIKNDFCEQCMYYCPLVEAWKKMGIPKNRRDLFCDIAMEGDRAKAKYAGLNLDIQKRIGKGDKFCRLILKK